MKKEKINWVIDKYMFEEYEDRLVAAIKDSGANVYFYDDICGKTFKEYITEKFTEEDIVIFHGSLQHGMQLSNLPIYPGVFMTIDNYECYKYYGYYGHHLLNSKYMMMGLNDVVRRYNDIKEMCQLIYSVCEGQKCARWVCENIFIRPSNGYKTFAGQLINVHNFEKDYEVLCNSYGGIDINTLVVLSPEKEIVEEYRFIVVDGKIITGSLYMDKNNMGTYKPYYNRIIETGDAFEFACKMTELYCPDSAYTIDVCKTIKGEYKLLEINSFNCASMYGCDYKKVVEAVNALAVKEYNSLWNEVI